MYYINDDTTFETTHQIQILKMIVPEPTTKQY